MIPRLVTALIFLFCGVMTALLVRSVLNPRGTGLAEVAPQVAFDLFSSHSTGSYLDIWEANSIVGKCEINPASAIIRDDRRQGRVKVQIKLLIRLAQPLLEARALKLDGDLQLHSDGRVDDLKLDLALKGSRPEISLAIRQPEGQEAPALKLMRGRETLLSLTPGREPEGIMAVVLETMLKSTGLPLDALRSNVKSADATATVHAGHFPAGDSRHDGYILTAGAEAAPQLVLFMANTGELLRLDTPFTGDSQLGLRFLAASLRPPGTPVPDLDEHLLLTPRAP